MQLFAPDPRPIHFMGIAGAGMSALALIAARRGVVVTGCDSDPRGADELAAAGVEIGAGHDPGHVEGARAVIHTAAVPSDHPELEAARMAGIPVWGRASALGDLVSSGRVVGVAGTHGKTTVTAMVTDAAVAAGLDPTGLVGGRVATWNGNARMGSEELFVVEENGLRTGPEIFVGPLWDITPDGQRFVMVRTNTGDDEGSRVRQINVVINWFEELQRLVPAP